MISLPGLMLDRWVFTDGLPLLLSPPQGGASGEGAVGAADLCPDPDRAKWPRGYSVGLVFAELRRLGKGYAELAELCG